MRRILVIGSGGAGKSTLAKRLGAILGIPVIHLDSLYWRPGWVETDKTEWADRVKRVISEDSWILDGNYSGTLAERLEACDTAVFVDLPRITCVWRVAKRSVTHHGKSRPDMPDGCPERLDVRFLLWIWRYPARSRPKVLSLLEQHRRTKKVIHLRAQADVERFVESLGNGSVFGGHAAGVPDT